MPLREHLDIVTGNSTYLDDVRFDNMAYLHVIRSPYARARITRIEGPGSRALLFLTANDIGDLLMPAVTAPNAKVVRMPVLPRNTVNFVGQPVAAVVTDSRYSLEDVADEVSIEYEPLRPVVTIDEALRNEEVIHPEIGTNISLDITLEGGDLNVFKEADVVVEREIEQARLVANPMEPKGCVVYYNGDKLLVYASTQSTFRVRSDLAEVLGLPIDKIVAKAPKNVGGGFGNKTPAYPEYVLAAIASMKLKRPVKWVETRTEHLNNATQGRGVKSRMKLYAKRDGTILGIEGEVIVNLGAYNFTINASSPIFIANLSTGPYRMLAARVRAVGVFTNTPPSGPYRGAGRPEAALIHETLIDDLADELGMDPVEVRRKNIIRDGETYKTPLGLVIDPANYQSILEDAARHYYELRSRYPGRGVSIAVFALYVSTFGGEGVRAVIGNGKLRLYIGSRPQGHAHVSAFTKYASEVFGVPEELIEVVPGDTETLNYGVGTFGSRSATVVAATITELAERVTSKLSSMGLSLIDAIKSRGVVIEEEVDYKPSIAILAPGAHVAVVDFDPETLVANVIDYYAVYNVGKPLLEEEVEAQLHGGILQGVAQVLWEGAAYGDDGTPLHSSLADYGLPSPPDVTYKVLTRGLNTPSIMPGGLRGIGEAGTVGALASTFLALEKAIRAKMNIRVKLNRMPVTPSYLHRLISN
ncbi:xanthine dehydrogenase family protein molybdopterin-binding subunit [Vulcanisaeta distributa]|uniref:Aldehyde oxidase and xanthine dehydrogenase molybdopterin binding protein n=1 Tax=Vulcanisaeta distributa (strain DSM 14429 / JCM 11212 / NBRC 100878 / IC-017) TaxID=572478 RepID=E1QTL9_VULDI|nr:xanthine dehydrogenase family protein molybdopterin-binding subunit [Vulcanisaeta distributa]ADN49734.1 aldehyde oxidase and xanthine dehydrogenase molybdopterin binding protein [Vulcanisaeta distributa DSM 14429]